MLLETLKNRTSALNKQGKVFVGILAFFAVFFVGDVLYEIISAAYAGYHASHLTNAEHLQMAREYCHNLAGVFSCIPDGEVAINHLKNISPGAPEYDEASKLMSQIQQFDEKNRIVREKAQKELNARIAQQQTERNRLMNQSQEDSRAQMLNNVTGLAHDSFICSISTAGYPILSFDYGNFWWNDDGRCAAKQEEQQAQLREQQIAKQKQEQQRRDQAAQLSSYWPTTIRVDTDMDSFWLPNEERTCQTYPDAKGRIATVACSNSGSHRDHNIPVKFWGGVDRNTISDWKCRRESDEFVCRAIN